VPAVPEVSEASLLSSAHAQKSSNSIFKFLKPSGEVLNGVKIWPIRRY